MDARRTRTLAGAVMFIGLLVATSAGPVSAADCTLSAPAYANVGTALTIKGSGFPASTSVDIAFSLDGSPADAFSVQSTADGGIVIALTPEDADLGVTTVQASAGSACTATATYTVLAAGETPGSAESPVPVTGSSAPHTDAIDAPATTGWSASALTMLAIALTLVGATGLLLTRTPRRP